MARRRDEPVGSAGSRRPSGGEAFEDEDQVLEFAAGVRANGAVVEGPPGARVVLGGSGDSERRPSSGGAVDGDGGGGARWFGVGEEGPRKVVVYEGTRDVVIGAEGGAPEQEKLGEAGAGVEGARTGELDPCGGGDEGRLGRGVELVVAVPEVECKLGEGQDSETGVEGRDVDADLAVLDGLGGAVVEERVEAGRSFRAVGAREGGASG